MEGAREPILLKNLSALVGSINDRLSVLRAESALLDAWGLRVGEKDKSGLVIDCGGGVAAQAPFDAFTASVPGDDLCPRTTIGPLDVELLARWNLTWHLALGFTGLSMAVPTGIVTLTSSAARALERHPLAHDRTLVCLSETELLREERASLDEVEKIVEERRALTLLAGLSRYTTLKFIEVFGRSPLDYIVAKLGEALDLLVVVTSGWLTSRDLELAKKRREIRLVHCPHLSAWRGRGGELPLDELVYAMRGRIFLGLCEPGFLTPYTNSWQPLLLERSLVAYTRWREIEVGDLASMMFSGWSLVDESKSQIGRGYSPDLLIYERPRSLGPGSSLLLELSSLKPKLALIDGLPIDLRRFEEESEKLYTNFRETSTLKPHRDA
ncbi:MAG: hypothetical protein QXU97_02015 [Fervidicoccaceae archaeon]